MFFILFENILVKIFITAQHLQRAHILNTDLFQLLKYIHNIYLLILLTDNSSYIDILSACICEDSVWWDFCVYSMWIMHKLDHRLA